MANVFIELSEKRKSLNDRLIRVQATLENKREQKEIACKKSRQLFGTDSPEELQLMIDDAISKNNTIEKQIKKENALAEQIIQLLEQGEIVPKSLIMELSVNETVNKPDKVKNTPQTKKNDQTEENRDTTENSELSTQEKADLKMIDKAMGSFTTANYNPLEAVLPDESKEHLAQAVIASIEDELTLDLGNDIDLSEVGTLEEVVDSMVTTKSPSSKKIVKEEVTIPIPVSNSSISNFF